MITNIVYVVGIVLLAALFAEIVSAIRKRGKVKIADRMSFKETLDLTELPIVTFKQGDKKLNFLLDTGATNSIINKSIIDELKHIPAKYVDTIYGADGNKEYVDVVEMDITYRDKPFKDMFYVYNLDAAFGNMKSKYGVNLHGIIGSSFFQKYKFMIDFDELVAYSVQ